MTAAKVRVALMEKTGALDVYFEDRIEILMPDEEPLREEAVKATVSQALFFDEHARSARR